MGADMIMNVALFWVIWKFFWKKSRTKHMTLNGRAGNADAVAFAIFVVAVVFFTFGPYLLDGGISMVLPFIVFGGIIAAYCITVRIPLGAEKENRVDGAYRIENR